MAFSPHGLNRLLNNAVRAIRALSGSGSSARPRGTAAGNRPQPRGGGAGGGFGGGGAGGHRRRTRGMPATIRALGPSATPPTPTAPPIRAKSSGPGCRTKKTIRRGRTAPSCWSATTAAVPAGTDADQPGPNNARSPGRGLRGHRHRRLGPAAAVPARSNWTVSSRSIPTTVRREGAVLDAGHASRQVAAELRRRGWK